MHTAFLSLDGFPGLGPVALPPQCVEDTEREHRMRTVRKATATVLAKERGRRVCSSVAHESSVLGRADEAQQWGLPIQALEREIERNLPASHPYCCPRLELMPSRLLCCQHTVSSSTTSFGAAVAMGSFSSAGMPGERSYYDRRALSYLASAESRTWRTNEHRWTGRVRSKSILCGCGRRGRFTAWVSALPPWI